MDALKPKIRADKNIKMGITLKKFKLLGAVMMMLSAFGTTVIPHLFGGLSNSNMWSLTAAVVCEVISWSALRGTRGYSFADIKTRIISTFTRSAFLCLRLFARFRTTLQPLAALSICARKTQCLVLLSHCLCFRELTWFARVLRVRKKWRQSQ